jgi:hypothetical protein
MQRMSSAYDSRALAADAAGDIGRRVELLLSTLNDLPMSTVTRAM